MPNETYNRAWCDERHKIIDERFKEVEAKYNKIILLLVSNLGIGLTVGVMLLVFRFAFSGG